LKRNTANLCETCHVPINAAAFHDDATMSRIRRRPPSRVATFLSCLAFACPKASGHSLRVAPRGCSRSFQVALCFSTALFSSSSPPNAYFELVLYFFCVEEISALGRAWVSCEISEVVGVHRVVPHLYRVWDEDVVTDQCRLLLLQIRAMDSSSSKKGKSKKV